MTHHWKAEDFRVTRQVLDPEVFLNGSNPPPSDLVSERVWRGIMGLPDHVSLTTSNHHGRLLGHLYNLWGSWVEATGDVDQPDSLFDPVLGACEDFQAALFCAINGYYRAAIGTLRNALELVVIGAYGAVLGQPEKFKLWRHGREELKFKEVCDALQSAPGLQALRSELRSKANDSLFDNRDRCHRPGIVRRLYAFLGKYAHSRPGFTDGALWESNGPIYVRRAFLLTAHCFALVSAVGLVIVKLGRPAFALPDHARLLFDSEYRFRSPVVTAAYKSLWPEGSVCSAV